MSSMSAVATGRTAQRCKNTMISGARLRPGVSLARAGHTLREYGVDERCGIVPGDGFTEVPGGGDVHLLKSVLHTMNDDDSVRVLTNCANALEPGGRILVLEQVMGEDGIVWGNVVDVAMLVMTGGRERTIQDYARLYERAASDSPAVRSCPAASA